MASFVLHIGMACGHRGNPTAILHVVQLYGVPVLLLGVSTLFLTKAEETIIEQHHKENVMNIQRLCSSTHRAVVFFLSGTLPGSALLHIRQLSIFGMILTLGESIIHQHAVNIFCSASESLKFWLCQIREFCLQYALPHPLKLLQEQRHLQEFCQEKCG